MDDQSDYYPWVQKAPFSNVCPPAAEGSCQLNVGAMVKAVAIPFAIAAAVPFAPAATEAFRYHAASAATNSRRHRLHLLSAHRGCCLLGWRFSYMRARKWRE
jgi:hypothetical protein